MSRNQGLSISEIAAELSISPTTVTSVLQTFLKIIRAHLIDAGYGPIAFIFFLQFSQLFS